MNPQKIKFRNGYIDFQPFDLVVPLDTWEPFLILEPVNLYCINDLSFGVGDRDRPIINPKTGAILSMFYLKNYGFMLEYFNREKFCDYLDGRAATRYYGERKAIKYYHTLSRKR